MINPKYAPKTIQQQRQDGQNALIRFFGAHDYAWLDRFKDLDDFEPNRAKHTAAGLKSRRHAQFAAALKEVDEKVQLNNPELMEVEQTSTKPKRNPKRKRTNDDESSLLSPSRVELSQVSSVAETVHMDENSEMLSPPSTAATKKSGRGRGRRPKEPDEEPPVKKAKVEDPDETIDRRLDPSTPIATTEKPIIISPTTQKLVIEETPVKKPEMSPVSPIVPQNWDGLNFLTPLAFPPTQPFVSQGGTDSLKYQSPSMMPTQVYKSPATPPEAKEKPDQNSAMDVDDPIKRLLYEDDDQIHKRVQESPFKVPMKDNKENNDAKITRADPTAKRKRGRAPKTDLPIADLEEKEHFKEAPTVEKSEINSNHEKNSADFVDSVPLFDDTPKTPLALLEKKNSSSPVRPRSKSPAVAKVMSKSKPAKASPVDPILLDTPAKITLAPLSSDSPPFELANVPEKLSGPSQASFLEGFMKEFLAVKNEFRSLGERMASLETQNKALEGKVKSQEDEIKDLKDSIEKQSVASKSLKTGLRDALKSQKDQVQTILNDQKHFIEEAIQGIKGPSATDTLDKFDKRIREELERINERLTLIESSSDGIVSAFLETAQSLKSKSQLTQRPLRSQLQTDGGKL